MQDRLTWTALHYSALQGDFEPIETILSIYPESERVQALNQTNGQGENVLHFVIESDSIKCIKAVLALYPESQRLEALNMRDTRGNTVLDKMDPDTRNAITELLQTGDGY